MEFTEDQKKQMEAIVKEAQQSRDEAEMAFISIEKSKRVIEDNEIKIRTIVETAVDGIIVINDQGIIESVNPAAEKLFDYRKEEVIGQNIKMLMPKPYQSEHDGYLKHYRETGEKKIIGIGREIIGKRKNGTEFPADLAVAEMNISGQKMFTGIIRDITERKKNEAQLLQQKKDLEKVNAELDSFVYTASHDLRAPLRGISSFAGFLDEDYRDKLDDEGREYLDEIQKGTQRLSTLIDDLLTLSRISRIRNPYEDVPINDLIEDIVKRVEFDVKEYRVDLVIQEKIPVVRCDRIKMGEVFLNLINNAIKFSSRNTKENPRVEVSYEDKGEVHEFRVKDNGIGIEPEYHDRVFGVFKRLHTNKEYEGSGAGLSIVKRVIEDHNGSIWIESELGKGASFCFTIPKNLDVQEKEKVYGEGRTS